MYSLFYTIFLVVFFPIYYFLIKKKGYKISLKEKIVLYTPVKLKQPIWFHCASVGELNTAKPLIEFYSKTSDVLITVSSPRGKIYAKKNFSDFEVRYLPFDYKFLIRRFINLYSPKILIVLEGEFWYNFITETSKHIPVISVNTRISPDSFKSYKKLSFLYKRIFNSFTKFLVRSKTDEKFLQFFVKDKSKIIVCGDLKFVSSSYKKDVFLEKGEKKVIVAGSTHDPEEKVLISVFKKLKKDFPDIVLIIAPRHLERIPDIVKFIENSGLTYSFRTDTKKLDTDIYIVNTIGELSGLYRYADLVFVGGTIADVGGHNILEPALENKPVVVGKNIYKIKDLFDLLKDYNVVFKADNDNQLFDTLYFLLKNGFKSNVNLKHIQEKIKNCYISNINKYLKEKI